MDLHSTDFDIAPYFIVDDLKKAELDSVICVNNELIQYVYLMPFSRGTVIGAYENAVAIECGNNDDESRIAQVSDIVRHISDHISRVIRHPKTVLKFQGELLSDEVETLSDDIRDFEPISVGTLIGTNQTGELVFAKESMRLFWVRNTFENPNIRAIRITST